MYSLAYWNYRYVHCAGAVTVVCMPTAVSQSAYKAWLYGSHMCKMTAYMQGLSFVHWHTLHFLAHVNSRSRSLFAVLSPVRLSSICLSVVCNVRAPYSGGSNFRQYFYSIRYLGHPLTFTENFMEIVPGEPWSAGGVKHKRGSQV